MKTIIIYCVNKAHDGIIKELGIIKDNKSLLPELITKEKLIKEVLNDKSVIIRTCDGINVHLIKEKYFRTSPDNTAINDLLNLPSSREFVINIVKEIIPLLEKFLDSFYKN